MNGPLDAAWDWYTGVRQTAAAARQVSHLWDELSDQGLVADRPSGAQLEAHAAAVARDLPDIAVVYLFSVFEAVVRADTAARVAAEKLGPRPVHPLYVGAMRGLDKLIEQGNVVELLNAYSSSADGTLRRMLAEVHGVREYRNWVAHGRRGDPPNGSAVTPELAKERLENFLYTVRAPVA